MEEKKNPKLVVGSILFKEITAKYLPYFLPSLKNQSFSDFQIIFFDNGSEAEDGINLKYIRENYSDIKILNLGKHIGFAAANNQIIKEALLLKADYYLTINPDVILEPDAISKMVEKIKSEENIASVSPKILKWDFENNKKTNIIDTCGIKMRSGLSFFDLGQGKADDQKICTGKIIGPSGACAMYKMKALQKIVEKDQYFDENMFMYKEDCDLAYKLFLLGFISKCVPEAVIYHHRTASMEGEGDLAIALNRKNKSKQVKIWSWRGQQIIFIKYWHLQSFWSKINIIFYEFKAFVFVLLFERYLIKELLTLWREKRNIKTYK